MTAAEAYKKTTDALSNGSEYYVEDHGEIMAEIEFACEDGEYSTEFDVDEFDDMEKHIKDLEKDGFRVRTEGDSYVVSWENAGVNSNQ